MIRAVQAEGRLGDDRFAKTTMKQPNVVFLFADQWRASAAGYAGDPNVKTPYIDQLAEESILFSGAVSSCPICTPYRASLLTGQYPLTTGLFMNDLCLSNEAVSLAEAYKSAGYTTAYIGKWHLDGHGRTNYIPAERRQGFEYWKVLECTHDYLQSFYYDDAPELKEWRGYDAYAQTEDAVEYIRKHDPVRPFLLLLSLGIPHNPYHTAPSDCQALYDPEKLVLPPNVTEDCAQQARGDLVGYYGHISALDRCVQQLDAALHGAGLADDTIFVVTSDHGDCVWSHTNANVGNINKQRPYDDSVLVPFLLRYPRRFGRTRRQVSAPFATPDIMPTLLELSGLDIPASVEGFSLAPLLLTDTAVERESVLIAGYAPFADWRWEKGGREYRGVRTERYTFARSLSGPWMLYDNLQDPYQLHNLVDNPQYRSVQEHLEAELHGVLQAQRDEFLSAAELCARWGYHGLSTNGAVPLEKGAGWYAKMAALRQR